MLNTTRFLLTEKEAGVAAAVAPMLARIRQNFSRPLEEDIEGAVQGGDYYVVQTRPQVGL